MTINVRDCGAQGDGQTDDTAAFVAALAKADSTAFSLPGMTLRGGAVVDVPAGVYRLSAPLMLHQRVHLRGESGAFLVFSSGGLVLDSNYNQAHAEVCVSGLHVYSTYGGTGVDARGGGYSLIERAVFGGWDCGVHLEASNGITVRDSVFSAWQGMGTQAGVGVRFALRSQLGGGATNGNSIERCQFNGRSIAIESQDGQGNVVRDSNINGGFEAVRLDGAQSLFLERVQVEGITGPTYIRVGLPGGYSQGKIVAMRFEIIGCSFVRNEPQKPSILRMEKSASIASLSLDADVWGSIPDQPVIACAAPWPDIRYVMISRLDRKRLRIANTPVSGPLRPVITDRDLYGVDT